MEMKFLDHFDWKVRRPLLRYRNEEIRNLHLRKDFSQMLVVENVPSEPGKSKIV